MTGVRRAWSFRSLSFLSFFSNSWNIRVHFAVFRVAFCRRIASDSVPPTINPERRDSHILHFWTLKSTKIQSQVPIQTTKVRLKVEFQVGLHNKNITLFRKWKRPATTFLPSSPPRPLPQKPLQVTVTTAVTVAITPGRPL
jgi:hypothetical protein